VFTHTRPCPPPGAGVRLAAAEAAVPLAGAGFAAAGLAEVFGLKRSASVFFAGEGDGLTAGAAAVVFAFRPRFAFGEAEAAGDCPAEGDVASVGEAAAAVFLDTRCFFAGAGDSAGDSAGAGD